MTIKLYPNVGKLLLLCFCIFSLLLPKSDAQTNEPNMPEKIDNTQALTLKSEHLEFVVEPFIGGRIASLKFHGVELLSQIRDKDDLHWGSTVWPSPQADWNWPPPVKMDQWPYSVKSAKKNVILLESTINAYESLKVTKRFELMDDHTIEITYRFINRGEEVVKTGIWENTRVPYAGSIRWTSAADKLSEIKGISHKNNTTHFELKDHEKSNKLFIASEGGWVAYYLEDIIFTKKIPIVKSSRIAPEQAAIEIYYDPETGFAEIEEHGPYVEIEPGRETRFKVKWVLAKKE